MSDHTPGPWLKAGRVGYGILITDQSGEAQIAVAYGPSTTSAGNANASVIAAAPDLLKACRVVTAYLDKLENQTDVIQDAELSALRRQAHAPLRAALDKAITKAEEL